MIRVLIADDSPTARSLLAAIIGSDPDLVVVGEAPDGRSAVSLTSKLRPDVVTMDIHMPQMDGFEATKEIMIESPTPIVICTSSHSVHHVEMSMHALRVGALAIVEKPAGPESPTFDGHAAELIGLIKAMSQVKVVRHWRPGAIGRAAPSTPARDAGKSVVAVAASTGGPAALYNLLAALPADFPAPLLVVQHISRGFISGLADWLNKAGQLHVQVAEEGTLPQKRNVYLAPDDVHLGLTPVGRIKLNTTPAIVGFRPSATFLFESAAQTFGASTTALVLTGMGDDGVAGLRAIRVAGGRILVQNENSCVVYGMPGAAVAAGLADEVLSIEQIATRLVEMVR